MSGVFTAILIASVIRPPYPEYIWLQHVPTVLVLIALPLWDRRWPMSRAALACLLGMLALHCVGARYLYTFVPYDSWTETLFDARISDVFEFERNHYDRLIHLCFGLLMIWPFREFLEVHKRYSRAGAIAVAIMTVMTVSLCYEVVEWVIAVLLSPDDAEAYNGQQGDFWDAQKDMALAAIGALAAGLAQWGLRTRRK